MFGYSNADKKIIRLIEKEEKHIGQDTVSALDLLKIAKKRYILMKEVLKPLTQSLSKEMQINNIYFVNAINDDFSINIEYKKDNKTGYLLIHELDNDDIEIILNTDKNKNEELVNKNKKIIINTFEYGLDNYFDKKSELTSTSGMFSLNIYNNLFELHEIDIHDLINFFKLSWELEVKDLYESVKIQTGSSILEDKFNSENTKLFLEHVKVYEKDIPDYIKNGI